MTLRKITIYNSVRYIPENEQTKKGASKPETLKAGSVPRKQSKNSSQNSKKFFKNVAGSGFAKLTK